jgi:hypothetical protein
VVEPTPKIFKVNLAIANPSTHDHNDHNQRNTQILCIRDLLTVGKLFPIPKLPFCARFGPRLPHIERSSTVSTLRAPRLRKPSPLQHLLRSIADIGERQRLISGSGTSVLTVLLSNVGSFSSSILCESLPIPATSQPLGAEQVS